MVNAKYHGVIFFAVCLAALGMLFMPASANAAAPNGISISPFIQQITIQPGDVQKSFTLILTNHTKTLQELNLSVKDFGSLNDTGGIILEGSKSYSQKYGLVSWLTLEKDTVVLPAGQSANVLVTIDNRTSLQPGGHYGAVVASINSFNQAAHENRVVINQQLTALVLANKVGGEHYDLKLKTIEQNGNWLHLPNTVKLIFQNPGNVHVVPRGIVSLKSPAGAVLAKGIINAESAYILPESFRQLYVELTPVGKSWPLPGLYSIQVDYRYDGLERFAHKRHFVHFIDLKLFVGLAFAGLLIWWYWPRLKHVRKTRR